MATSLFNLHVQTTRDGEVAHHIGRAREGSPAVVTPARDGWVSVFLKDTFATSQIARSLSEAMDTVVVTFEVYGNDSCDSRVFRSGRLVARDLHNPEFGSKRGVTARFARYARPGSERALAKTFATKSAPYDKIAKAI